MSTCASINQRKQESEVTLDANDHKHTGVTLYSNVTDIRFARGEHEVSNTFTHQTMQGRLPGLTAEQEAPTSR